MEIGSETWKCLIRDGARAFGIDIDSTRLDQFSVYARELIGWNRKINLTSITDPSEIAAKHVLDSIIPSSRIPASARLLDIGSGGGFPGIPLKIMHPSLQVTLIDASRKKVNFLKHIIRLLNLDAIEALHVRAQDLANQPDYIRSFDVVVSRALTRTREFADMAAPMLREGGMIMAMKGRDTEMDVQTGRTVVVAARAFEADIQTYALPYVQSLRTLVMLTSVGR